MNRYYVSNHHFKSNKRDYVFVEVFKILSKDLLLLHNFEKNTDFIEKGDITQYYDENLEADDMLAIKVAEAIQNPDYEIIWVFSSDADTHQFFSWDERING